MNITITSLALIAGISTTIASPVTVTSVEPAQSQLLSKDELVQIISNEKHANINLDDIALTLPSITLNDGIQVAKTFLVPKKSATIVTVEKARSDD